MRFRAARLLQPERPVHRSDVGDRDPGVRPGQGVLRIERPVEHKGVDTRRPRGDVPGGARRPASIASGTMGVSGLSPSNRSVHVTRFHAPSVVARPHRGRRRIPPRTTGARWRYATVYHVSRTWYVGLVVGRARTRIDRGARPGRCSPVGTPSRPRSAGVVESAPGSDGRSSRRWATGISGGHSDAGTPRTVSRGWKPDPSLRASTRGRGA